MVEEMMHALQLVTPAYPGSREILPGQTYLLQGDPPKKIKPKQIDGLQGVLTRHYFEF